MFLTVAEAAKKRGVTRYSIHRWIASGLPFTWIEGKRVIDAADLDRFTPRRVGNPNFGKPQMIGGLPRPESSHALP